MSAIITLRNMNYLNLEEITDWDEKAYIYDHSTVIEMTETTDGIVITHSDIVQFNGFWYILVYKMERGRIRQDADGWTAFKMPPSFITTAIWNYVDSRDFEEDDDVS